MLIQPCYTYQAYWNHKCWWIWLWPCAQHAYPGSNEAAGRGVSQFNWAVNMWHRRRILFKRMKVKGHEWKPLVVHEEHFVFWTSLKVLKPYSKSFNLSTHRYLKGDMIHFNHKNLNLRWQSNGHWLSVWFVAWKSSKCLLAVGVFCWTFQRRSVKFGTPAPSLSNSMDSVRSVWCVKKWLF